MEYRTESYELLNGPNGGGSADAATVGSDRPEYSRADYDSGMPSEPAVDGHRPYLGGACSVYDVRCRRSRPARVTLTSMLRRFLRRIRDCSSSSRRRSSRSFRRRSACSALVKSFWLTTAIAAGQIREHAQAVLRRCARSPATPSCRSSRRGPGRRRGRAGRSCRSSSWRGWPRASAPDRSRDQIGERELVARCGVNGSLGLPMLPLLPSLLSTSLRSVP